MTLCSLEEVVRAQKEEPSLCDIKKFREDEESFGVGGDSWE